MAALASAPLSSACVQNHDILAAQPNPAGAGGAVVRTMPSAGGAGGVPVAPEDSGPPPIQAEGPRTLTVVNGVVDSPWVALCFAPVKAGVERPATGAPVPASGLVYGATAEFDSLTGIDLAADGVRPYLVAGAGPSAAAGLDCAAIVAQAHPKSPPQVPAPDAAPPPPDASDSGSADAASSVDASVSLDATIPLDASKTGSVEASTVDATVPIPLVRFAALPVIPSGQLAVLHGYLLVLSGCVGGPGVTDSAEEAVCGSSYSAATPTLGPELVAPSRAAPSDWVALAFLNGSPAFSPVTFNLARPRAGTPSPLRTTSSPAPSVLVRRSGATAPKTSRRRARTPQFKFTLAGPIRRPTTNRGRRRSTLGTSPASPTVGPTP